MVEHSASVQVNAPVHQVYTLFSHFHDFPKFMSFVKEVTYYDEQRSHWVVKVVGELEWDAVNEDWIPDQQIGWRSTRGMENSGRVKFHALGPERTAVYVYIRYRPPTGPLGGLGEQLGINAYFDAILQKNLAHFARMVEETPSGEFDPMSSHYLFHKESAFSRGEVTAHQKMAMDNDPMMNAQVLKQRQTRVEEETRSKQRLESEHAKAQQQKREHEQRLRQEQRELLRREAEKKRQTQLTGQGTRRTALAAPLDPRHTYAALARGLGDKDGLRARIPNFAQDPMTSRRPLKAQPPVTPPRAE